MHHRPTLARRVIGVIAAAGLAVGLAACSDDSDDSSSNGS